MAESDRCQLAVAQRWPGVRFSAQRSETSGLVCGGVQWVENMFFLRGNLARDVKLKMTPTHWDEMRRGP